MTQTDPIEAWIAAAPPGVHIRTERGARGTDSRWSQRHVVTTPWTPTATTPAGKPTDAETEWRVTIGTPTFGGTITWPAHDETHARRMAAGTHAPAQVERRVCGPWMPADAGPAQREPAHILESLGPGWTIHHPDDCPDAPDCLTMRLAREQLTDTIQTLPDGRWEIEVNDLGDRVGIYDRVDEPAGD